MDYTPGIGFRQALVKTSGNNPDLMVYSGAELKGVTGVNLLDALAIFASLREVQRERLQSHCCHSVIIGHYGDLGHFLYCAIASAAAFDSFSPTA